MKEIKVLGTGCAKCKKLAENAENAASEMQIEYRLQKVTDLNDIMGYGVMMTPGLVINGEVAAVGKVPDVEKIKQMLR